LTAGRSPARLPVPSRNEPLSELPGGGRIAELVDIDLSRFDQRLLFDQRIKCHRGSTHEILAAPGRHLVFNDFAHVDDDFGQYGAHRAVIDFALKARWPMAFLAFSEDPLHDVALRKPECSFRVADSNYARRAGLSHH